jgi:SAM-dependent methyltransferase
MFMALITHHHLSRIITYKGITFAKNAGFFFQFSNFGYFWPLKMTFDPNFTKAYINVRQREGRLLPDAAVEHLPWKPPDGASAQEWRWRAQSFTQLSHYLLRLYGKKHISILDIGCGNGWMSNRLAENVHWRVLGIDVNEPELNQAKRLFARENLQFQQVHVLDNTLSAAQFDVVVLAASVQYFPDLPVLIASIERILKPGGEIHITDAPFYNSPTAREQARQRSADYYTRQGVPEMTDFYFHHLVSDIQLLGFQALNNGLWHKIQRKTGRISPFLWWKKSFC